MTWSRKLAKPIALKDGRTIASLAEAHALMLSLPPIHRHSAVWQYAAKLLNEAVEDKDSLADAVAQLERALKADGLI